jgi:hypothetical protein
MSSRAVVGVLPMNFTRAADARSRLARMAYSLAVLALPSTLLAQNFAAVPAPAQPAQVVNFASGPLGQTQYLTTGNGSTVTLPVTRSGAPGFSRQNGLQLSIDINWPGQYGYRPVVFKLTSKTAATADRRITIKFTSGDWVPPRGKAISVKQSFTFPAGATTASQMLLVPRFQDWQIATWRVEVDGRSDDYLGIDQMYFGNMGISQAGAGVMSLGLNPAQISASNILLQNASNGLGVNVMPMDDKPLPANWVEYSTLDVFIMPAARFEKLADDEPRQTEALLRWVRSGGNLWLTRCGNRWQRLPTIERSLGVEVRVESDGEVSPEVAAEARGWRFPPIGDRSTEPSEGALLLAEFNTGSPKAGSWSGLIAKYLPKGVQPQRQFVVRGYGLGVVTAFRHDLNGGSMTTNNGTVNVITQSLLGPRMTWASRFANQPDQANEEFNNLLIPNVGVAPVGLFQVLITLFVIVIGPLNYWLLQRKNKLPMLLVTAPAAALATTILLFAYGMISDGFEVQARARTLTLLDQREGDVVSWGRLSYYAGIAPRNGLSVPSDQLMYPIMPLWAAGRYGGRATGAPREMTWAKDQELTRGWLASRTPTQYQAVISRPSKKRLDLRVTDKGLQVVNRLGVDVTHLAVEDHDGRFYWCENLADGKGQVVPATDQNVLAKGVRQLFTANLPESPGGDEIRYGGNYGLSLSQSIMEGRLEAINSPVIQSWGPGKYIAFTDRAIELDLGLDDLVEEASFHVIEGTW